MNTQTGYQRVRRRDLLEFVRAESAAPLRVDQQAGVIFGVKVLGQYSRNNHGLKEAIGGTEYTLESMKEAIPLYEGVKVRCNHPSRKSPGEDRDVDDTFGVLRNVRLESDGLRGDLHYLVNHPMAARVVEDVEKMLDVFGLSHNASSARERFDRKTKRLVIEQIGEVRSVDLVDRPATNRNLRESWSKTMPRQITLRSLLEGIFKSTKSSKGRKAWAKRILEADDYQDPMSEEASVEVADGATDPDPDDAMTSAFESSLMAVVRSALKGDSDPKEALKKIKELLTTHGKLTGSDDPEDPPPLEESDDDKTKSKMESENKRLKAELHARELCESEGLAKPSKAVLKALVLLESDAERKDLIAATKSSSSASRTVRSSAPGAQPPVKRPLVESYDADADLTALRNG